MKIGPPYPFLFMFLVLAPGGYVEVKMILGLKLGGHCDYIGFRNLGFRVSSVSTMWGSGR